MRKKKTPEELAKEAEMEEEDEFTSKKELRYVHVNIFFSFPFPHRRTQMYTKRTRVGGGCVHYMLCTRIEKPETH